VALQPMPSPRGCQTTSTRVAMKISVAMSIGRGAAAAMMDETGPCRRDFSPSGPERTPRRRPPGRKIADGAARGAMDAHDNVERQWHDREDDMVRKQGWRLAGGIPLLWGAADAFAAQDVVRTLDPVVVGSTRMETSV